MTNRKVTNQLVGQQRELKPVFRFKGNYCLVGQTTKRTSIGELVSVLHLSDATSEIKVYCRDQSCISDKLTPNNLIHVEAQLVVSEKGCYWLCKHVELANIQLSNRHLSYLPSAICPIDGAIIRLMELVSRISNEHLRVFVQRVLMNQHVAIQYLICPARLDATYNFSGGLIAEAIETSYAITMYSNINQQERDLALVTAILGNVGLTQTYTSDLKETALGTLIDGRKLSIEICRDELSQLHKVEPQLSEKLHVLLTHSDCIPPQISPQLSRLMQILEACRSLHYKF